MGACLLQPKQLLRGISWVLRPTCEASHWLLLVRARKHDTSLHTATPSPFAILIGLVMSEVPGMEGSNCVAATLTKAQRRWKTPV